MIGRSNARATELASSPLLATDPACIVCSETRSTSVLNVDGRSLQQCETCGFLFVLPRPTRTELDHLYSEAYYEPDQADALGYRSPVFDQCLDAIGRHRSHCGLLLDIGCGTGEFVKAAGQRGWIASGVELSTRAAELARRKGLDVRCGTLSSAGFSVGCFEVVTCLDVLEHVSQPMQELEQVRELLADGGLFVVRVPNTLFHLAKTRICAALGVKDVGLQMEYHLNHFTPRTLQGVLKRCGLRTIALEVGAPESIAHAAWASLRAKRTYVRLARYLNAVTGIHLENIMVAYAEKAN